VVGGIVVDFQMLTSVRGDVEVVRQE